MSKFNTMINNVSSSLQKHSPEILLGLGICGTIGAAIAACVATKKLDDMLEESNNNIKEIKQKVETEEMTAEEVDNVKKELSKEYIKTGAKIAVLYLPSLVLGALSITSLVASNKESKKRYIEAGALLVASQESYRQYRQNVIERFGEEVDRELLYGITSDEIEETYTDEKTGKEKKRKRKVDIVNPDKIADMYTFIFTGSPCSQNEPHHDLTWLKLVQNMLNQRLTLTPNTKIFLNDVLDELGLDHVSYGQRIGWRYDPNNPNLNNCIDLGLREAWRKADQDIEDGDPKPIIMITLNPDGDILTEWEEEEVNND